MSYPDPVDTLAKTQRLLLIANARIKALEQQLAALKLREVVVPEAVYTTLPVNRLPEETVEETPKKKKKNGPID